MDSPDSKFIVEIWDPSLEKRALRNAIRYIMNQYSDENLETLWSLLEKECNMKVITHNFHFNKDNDRHLIITVDFGTEEKYFWTMLKWS